MTRNEHGEFVYTEQEANSMKKFYPRKQKPYKERTERTSFSDQVCGTLNPIVYALNKGKTISPKSPEHKALMELLTKANA